MRQSFTVDTTTNRLGVPAGQPEVMTYDSAGNLTTDTYTGAGRATGKTADFIINGAVTELKTLQAAGPNTLKNAIESASQQGQHILIDARNVMVNQQDAILRSIVRKAALAGCKGVLQS